MTNGNNDKIVLESIRSKPEIQLSDSTENINSEDKNSSCSTRHVIISVLDVINHTLIIMVTIYLIYRTLKAKYTITSIHLILCTIGYVLLMSEAIIVLAGDNVLTGRWSRRANKHLHWVLQAIGLIFNLVGVGIMYNAKTAHFRSIHGITGISSLVIVCAVTVFGYPVWIAWKLRKFVRPVITKFLHNFLGTAGFVIGMVSQCYAYTKGWLYEASQTEHDVLLALTVLITILSLRGSLVSLCRQAVGSLT
ncbi:transmembrane reductase CYB561D2 [Linepithema humile]|uniref:transmembrane reductase CYB561D2 n=1 Tax=Linepithema humile TaxID=83485 RepID=UPI0006231A43|nr:PREDICTED: uncharacterized protein LOC105668572 [Linepithema humile]